MGFEITNNDLQAVRQHINHQDLRDKQAAKTMLAGFVTPLKIVEEDQDEPHFIPPSPNRLEEMAGSIFVGTQSLGKLALTTFYGKNNPIPSTTPSSVLWVAIKNVIESLKLSERLQYVLCQHIRQLDIERGETEDIVAQLAYRFSPAHLVWPFKNMVDGETSIQIAVLDPHQLQLIISKQPKIQLSNGALITANQDTVITLVDNAGLINCTANVICGDIVHDDLKVLTEDHQFNHNIPLYKTIEGLPLTKLDKVVLVAFGKRLTKSITENKLPRGDMQDATRYILNLAQRLYKKNTVLLDAELGLAWQLSQCDKTRVLIGYKAFQRLRQAMSSPRILRTIRPRWYRRASSNTATLLKTIGIKPNYSAKTSYTFSGDKGSAKRHLTPNAKLVCLHAMLTEWPKTLAKGLCAAQLNQLSALLSANNEDNAPVSQLKTSVRNQLVGALLQYNPRLLNESSYKDRLLNPENLPAALLSKQLDCRKTLFEKNVRQNKVIQLMAALAGKQSDNTTAKHLLGLPAKKRWWHRFVKPEAVKLSAQLPAAACVSLLEAKPTLTFDYVEQLVALPERTAQFDEAQLTQLCGLLTGEQIGILQNHEALTKNLLVLRVLGQLNKLPNKARSLSPHQEKVKDEIPAKETYGAPTSAFLKSAQADASAGTFSTATAARTLTVKIQ